MSEPAAAGTPELAAAAATLYGTRPEEFVAARAAIVKELRAAKARDAAREVATWRRPSVADWGLNQVARQADSPLPAFLAAAATARDAQAGALEGRGGAGDLRAAVAELRGASEAVIRAADGALASEGRAAGSQLGALASRLTEVAATEELAEQLRAGCLGAGSVTIVDLFGGEAAPVADRAAPARRAGSKTSDQGVRPRPPGGRRAAAGGNRARGGGGGRGGAAAAAACRRRRALEDALEGARSRHEAAEADRAHAVERAEAAQEALAAARRAGGGGPRRPRHGGGGAPAGRGGRAGGGGRGRRRHDRRRAGR